MVTRLLAGSCLMALCVAIHAWGLSWAFQSLRRSSLLGSRLWRSTALFIVVAVWIVLLHLVEISVWAAMYVWNGAITDLPSALYFSAVTYTTTGYGDIVLPKEWRLDGAVEALTGILMCGWSTGFFFAIVNRLYEHHASTTSA
jgi:ion channel